MFSLIHKEGHTFLLGSGLALAVLNGVLWYYFPAVFWFVLAISVVLYVLFVQFFRNPPRPVQIQDDTRVYAPADGKVVVIEEVEEKEYFKDRRLQVSVFMSPLNVHVNRNPVGGKVAFFRYHPGKFLVAWHPKSSEENERTTVVYDTGKRQIMIRQIAGALAKRIRWYVQEGQTVVQGADMGFIKFGSRVDIFLPLDAQVEVRINDVVKGNQTLIARLDK